MTRRVRADTWRRYRGAIDGEAGDGWHKLRHHHASKLLSEGVSVVAVAERLGHKDATETLRTYAHLMPGDAEAMEAVATSSARSLLDALWTLPASEMASGRSLDAKKWRH